MTAKKLRELTYGDVRDRIKSLEEAQQATDLLIKTWVERGDREWVEGRIAKQAAVIREAKGKIDRLLHDQRAALDELKKLRAQKRRQAQKLATFKSLKTVKRLLEAADELKRLNSSKESNHDEKVHSPAEGR